MSEQLYNIHWKSPSEETDMNTEPYSFEEAVRIMRSGIINFPSYRYSLIPVEEKREEKDKKLTEEEYCKLLLEMLGFQVNVTTKHGFYISHPKTEANQYINSVHFSLIVYILQPLVDLIKEIEELKHKASMVDGLIRVLNVASGG